MYEYGIPHVLHSCNMFMPLRTIKEGVPYKTNDTCIKTIYIYSVIHKSLRDFRPLRYSSRDGHAEGEHVNRGRDSKFLSYLTGARYVHPW
jgi:hypothetical protein